MVVLGLATSQVAAQEDVERRQEVAIVPAATTLLDQITITATMAAQAVIDAFFGHQPRIGRGGGAPPARYRRRPVPPGSRGARLAERR